LRRDLERSAARRRPQTVPGGPTPPAPEMSPPRPAGTFQVSDRSVGRSARAYTGRATPLAEAQCAIAEWAATSRPPQRRHAGGPGALGPFQVFATRYLAASWPTSSSIDAGSPGRGSHSPRPRRSAASPGPLRERPPLGRPPCGGSKSSFRSAWAPQGPPVEGGRGRRPRRVRLRRHRRPGEPRRRSFAKPPALRPNSRARARCVRPSQAP